MRNARTSAGAACIRRGVAAGMSWSVYLIEGRNGALYTGISTDVASRYAAHAAGRGARYTRANPPLRLLGSLPCGDRAAASRAEYRIRRLSPAAKRALFAAEASPGPEPRVHAADAS